MVTHEKLAQPMNCLCFLDSEAVISLLLLLVLLTSSKTLQLPSLASSDSRPLTSSPLEFECKIAAAETQPLIGLYNQE